MFILKHIIRVPNSRPGHPHSDGHRKKVVGTSGQMDSGGRSGLLPGGHQPGSHPEPACGRLEHHPRRPQPGLHLLPLRACRELQHRGAILDAPVCPDNIEAPSVKTSGTYRRLCFKMRNVERNRNSCGRRAVVYRSVIPNQEYRR